MSSIFKEVSLAKSLDLLLGKVLKEVMKVGDDFTTLLEAKVAKGEA